MKIKGPVYLQGETGPLEKPSGGTAAISPRCIAFMNFTFWTTIIKQDTHDDIMKRSEGCKDDNKVQR